MKNFNSWNKWGRLRTVLLGTCYPNDFFDAIENEDLKRSLTRILKETNEDLENFKNILESHGVTVLRTENLINKLEECKKEKVPVPIMCPRDTHIIIGNKAIAFNDGTVINKVKETLVEYAGTDENIVHLRLDNFGAPCATLVGKDLYIDLVGENGLRTNLEQMKVVNQQLQEMFPDLRINNLTIGGHSDGCFQPIKPNCVLSLLDIQNYNKTFPDWKVCYLEGESWDKVENIMEFKKKINGKWWVEGEEENDELIFFVEEWLDNWVGYVEESVFDVNVLMLDEKNMFVSSLNNDIVNKFAEENDINLILVQWRHRYFWDGGLHCITLDLERDGVMEDYFPERKEPVSDDITDVENITS